MRLITVSWMCKTAAERYKLHYCDSDGVWKTNEAWPIQPEERYRRLLAFGSDPTPEQIASVLNYRWWYTPMCSLCETYYESVVEFTLCRSCERSSELCRSCLESAISKFPVPAKEEVQS